MKKVCIIGAGAGGLSALKYVSENPNFKAVVFERAGSIGGIWRYCENKGMPETTERFPTPMYSNLRMNTPHLMCQLLDFPWPENTDTFPTRVDALKYFQSYANTFNLMGRIYFHHEVVNVKPIDPKNRENPQWNVVVKDLNTESVTIHEFDVILVCTGREMEPYIPYIPNLELFMGNIMTADEYTTPEVFTGQRVLFLGGGPSTIDLSLAVLPVAKEVIVSCKPIPKVFNIVQKFPRGIRTVVPWKSATPNGFILQDDTKLDGIDAVIIAAGYDFNHTFLAPGCGISLENGRRVNFLYRHMVNVKFPTMFFIGVSFYAAGIGMFSVLSKWISKVLDGTVKLPNESDMMRDIKKCREEIISLGLNEFSFAHNICIQQWKLFDELAKEGGFELNPYAQQIFTHFMRRLFTDPANFRKDIYKKIDEKTVHIEVVSE